MCALRSPPGLRALVLPPSSSFPPRSPPDPTPSIRPTGRWRGTYGPLGASSAGLLLYNFSFRGGHGGHGGHGQPSSGFSLVIGVSPHPRPPTQRAAAAVASRAAAQPLSLAPPPWRLRTPCRRRRLLRGSGWGVRWRCTLSPRLGQCTRTLARCSLSGSTAHRHTLNGGKECTLFLLLA